MNENWFFLQLYELRHLVLEFLSGEVTYTIKFPLMIIVPFLWVVYSLGNSMHKQYMNYGKSGRIHWAKFLWFPVFQAYYKSFPVNISASV